MYSWKSKFTSLSCFKPREKFSSNWIKYLISGGLGLQRLGARLGFAAGDWAEPWWWEYQILAARPEVSDKGPGPSTMQKRIPTKMESSEASEVFIKRKNNTVPMDRHMGRIRGIVPELPPHGTLNHWYGPCLLDFLWPIILICLIPSPHLVYISNFPRVCMHLLAKMDSTAKAYG